LYELGDWLPAALKGPYWPDLATLNTALSLPAREGGRPLRLVSAGCEGEADMGYEQRIHAHGQIVTRNRNWHDFFNALVWSRFPCLKLALNAMHCKDAGRHASRQRSSRRDALTLFDECGLIVLSARSELLEELSRHRWCEAFLAMRAEWKDRVRVLVFGHALYAQALSPFPGWTAKALLLHLPVGEPAFADASLRTRVDEAMARLVRRGLVLSTTTDLSPVPLLGIPGMDPANAAPSYYDDARYFRPRRAGRPAAPLFTLSRRL